MVEGYRRELRPLLMAALESDQLKHWSAGILTASGRRLDARMKDAAILALETYLETHNDAPGHVINPELLTAFAAEVQSVCNDETLSLRINYNGVTWLLDAWRYLAHRGWQDQEDPRMILPACAMLGSGIHAAAFHAIPEGVRQLMHMASHAGWPIRDVAPMGLQQMLAEDWSRTMHELRRYVLIGDTYQRRAAALAVVTPELLRERDHALDALDLYHVILAAFRRLDFARRHGEPARMLAAALSLTLRTLLLAEREAGFAAVRTWLAWNDSDIRVIVQTAVAMQPLASFEEAVFIRQHFSN